MKNDSIIPITLALILIPAIWTGQKQEVSRPTEAVDLVTAKRFQLTDENGIVRIEMRMDDDNPVISIKDSDGVDRISIFQKPDADGMYINDAEGHTRIGVAQFPHGGGIAMHGPNGSPSAVYVMINDTARLEIYDTDGKLANRWPKKPDPAADK